MNVIFSLLVGLLSVLNPLLCEAQQPVSQISAQDLLDANREWGLSYFNFASTAANLANEGPSSWGIYQFVAFNYRFNWSERLSLRLPFTTQTPGMHDPRGNVRNFNTQRGDIHLVYNQFNLLELPYEWDMSASYYIYLPTSDNAISRRWIARTRAWFNFETKLNRRTLFAVWVQPEYFINTQKSFRKETNNLAPDGSVFYRVRAANNTKGSLQTSLVASYALNSIFTPQVTLGYNQIWTENSEFITDQATYRDSIGLQLATWITINRTLRLLAGYSNEVNMTNRFRSEEPKFLQPEDSQYFIMTFWNLF
jgi:hypothetical protein